MSLLKFGVVNKNMAIDQGPKVYPPPPFFCFLFF
jgi:hypothetical protein